MNTGDLFDSAPAVPAPLFIGLDVASKPDLTAIQDGERAYYIQEVRKGVYGISWREGARRGVIGSTYPSTEKALETLREHYGVRYVR